MAALRTTCLLLCILAACNVSPGEQEFSSELPDTVDYNFHIKPILSDRCYACHGPDDNARQAGLRLFLEAGAKMERLESGGHAIVPGSLRRSKLYQRIMDDDPDGIMPPPESNLMLTEREKALIARWLEQGAEWKPHWAFIPVTSPDAPEVQVASWPRNAVDNFVLARLEHEGLGPSPQASREALLRRVTFDLTGLPPTLAEIDSFLADTSATAYESVVDRLLASSAYGEHMASEWLDVSRYADTHGYQSDRERRMWPWRDWVIKAFNDNIGYDDFLTWQLAGDLLPNATREQHLATAFNRNHRQTEEGGSIEEEFRVEYVADRTNTTATAFLGLTMECARCHDHKYDPISQKEYYQFFSFFQNIDESGQTSHFTDAVPVPALPLPNEQTQQELETLKGQIAAQEDVLQATAQAARNDFESWKPGPPVRNVLPIRGLVAAFEFEDTRSGIIENLVPTGPGGATQYDPVVVPGHVGNALTFDGENGAFFEDVGVFTRTDPFTLSLWIKVAAYEEWNVLAHRTQAALDAGSRGYELSMQDGHLVAGLTHMWPENAVRVVTDQRAPLDEWVHVAMTYDGSSRADGVYIYMNGKEASVAVVRDNLTRNITYERVDVHLTLGYRFRDTGFKDGLVDAFRIYDRALTRLEIAQLADRGDTPNDEALFAYYLSQHHTATREARDALRNLRLRQNELVSSTPEIMVMREMAMPRQGAVLERGRYDREGDPVSPGTPESILPFPETLPRNRLGLARWLLDPQNPLTARVAVNRFWQRLFGTGIVATAEDFGSQGALPSHPELLEYLASTFVASKWDIKAMQRLLVTSATYRQASLASPVLIERDPDNRLLARGPRLRLTAEMVRDAALAASGLLVRKVGGPSVRPYQPSGLWEEKSGVKYVRGTGDDLYRRSLYTFFKRTSPPPSMIVFDMPMRSQCTMRRQRTTTPMQALVLLNDPQFVEAARHIGGRMLTEGGATLDSRIDYAFRLVTGRRPDKEEREVLIALYNEQRRLFAEDHARAKQLLETGESSRYTSLDAVDLAASTVVASALMNFDEAVTKR